ncbi:MAG: ATP-binding cassette domain-containing protein [Desulfobacterales bacterium]|nr:ATP-binding cassette domain-containing protein [Desulfobacterales bacterium]
MPGRFEMIFPLVMEWDDSFSITFNSTEGKPMVFSDGIYYLEGDNGSGKTTFMNLLALTAGRISQKAIAGRGTVRFNDIAYNGGGLDPLKAADIREEYFCIYPQKAFFLPVSTRDNYMILNGSDPEKARHFSGRQFPDLLSGGQQQQVLMDIVLDDKKPVWFLDEPLTNLDAERRLYFWKTLRHGYKRALRTIFFIDHWIGAQIKQDPDFKRYNSLQVTLENSQGGKQSEIETKQIDIYASHSPNTFFDSQIKKSEREGLCSSSL